MSFREEHAVLLWSVCLFPSLLLTYPGLRAARRAGGDAVSAVCSSFAATVPGTLLIVELLLRGYGWRVVRNPEEVMSLLLVALWLFVGPLLFVFSHMFQSLRKRSWPLRVMFFAHLLSWGVSTIAVLAILTSV